MIEIPKTVKGLIFDLDGTIANTMQNHFIAWRKAVSPYGIEFTPSLFMQLTGMPRSATIVKMNELFNTDMDPETVGALKSQYYKESEHLTEEISVVTDVVRKYHGVLPMAIGTGSTRSRATRTLDTIGLTSYFKWVVTADDITNPKPHPQTFLNCAELMGVAPEDCVVFEDGILGMEAAREAGMLVVDINAYFQLEFKS